MVAIARTETAARLSVDPATASAVEPPHGERRWSGRRTLAFVVAASAAGWCAIGYTVFTLIKH